MKALLADADLALASTEFEDVRGNAAIVQQTVRKARRMYDDLLRRREQLTLPPAEAATLQAKLDLLRARLRFFKENV